jgi:hypothetical protein
VSGNQGNGFNSGMQSVGTLDVTTLWNEPDGVIDEQ